MSCPCLSKVTPSVASLEEEVKLENCMWVDDTKIDISTRLEFEKDMGQPQIYSNEEDSIITAGVSLLAMFDSSELKLAPLKMKSPLLLNPSILVKKNDNNVYGSVRCLIRGATVEKAVAYLLCYNSRLADKYERNPLYVDKSIIATLNSHHSIFHYRIRAPAFFANFKVRDRDFLASFVWKQLSPTQFVVISGPPPDHQSVRPPPLTSSAARAPASCV